jgi:hypothetical protein
MDVRTSGQGLMYGMAAAVHVIAEVGRRLLQSFRTVVRHEQEKSAMPPGGRHGALPILCLPLSVMRQVSNYLSFSREDSDEQKKAELAGVVTAGEQIWVKVRARVRDCVCIRVLEF